MRHLHQRLAVSHFMTLEKFFRSEKGVEILEDCIAEVAEVKDDTPAYKQIHCSPQRQDGHTRARQNAASASTTQLVPFGASSFGGSYQLTPLLELLRNAHLLKGSQCGICDSAEGEFNDPRILDVSVMLYSSY